MLDSLELRHRPDAIARAAVAAAARGCDVGVVIRRMAGAACADPQVYGWLATVLVRAVTALPMLLGVWFVSGLVFIGPALYQWGFLEFYDRVISG